MPTALATVTLVSQVPGNPTKLNLDAFTPPGPGRDLVIMNCDNCHPWVCAIRGQRTLAHWQYVEDFHRYNWQVVLPDDEWDPLFSYLEKNFNDQKPEPDLPPELQGFGCTLASLR